MDIPNLPADYRQRVDANLASWKRKLLDLTRRNRALSFKPTKVSTIVVVDEHAPEVFRRIYLQEAPMRFKAAPVKTAVAEGQAESNGAPTEAFDFNSESEGSLEFVPYDPASLDERHTDEWLQTKLAPEALDHSLRRIDEQARAAMEEQGVNTLFLALGMLRYRESAVSDEWMRAPLVMVPVQLTRKSARGGYTLLLGDEDALINPALAEHLRASFGIALPDLPDGESISDSYDLQEFFRGVSDAVSAQTGWAVHPDIWLGLFSFQKFVMFKDLEKNGDAIGAHRLVRQLLTHTGAPEIHLPKDVRDAKLDSVFPPESTHQVVDADSSQMRAAATVAKGYDVVIEGPPGTGKSQTITNLVAQALAAGKSVLFVAEKMAALDVVHRRLVQVGLGDFCLEMHASKANKRAVMQELSRSLDASLQSIAGVTAATRRLPETRGRLADYVSAVHEPFGALGRSPYAVAGDLGAVLGAPTVALDDAIADVTPDVLDDTIAKIRDFEAHANQIGTPLEHPWHASGRTFYTPADLEWADAAVRQVHQLSQSVTATAAIAAEVLGVPVPSTIADVESFADLVDLLGASPGVPEDVLCSDGWNSPPRQATTLLENGRRYAASRAQLATRFVDDAFASEHGADVDYIEQKASGIFGFLAILDGRYRSIKRRWMAFRKEGYSAGILEQAAEMRNLDACNRRRLELDSASEADSLFGPVWRGSATDWDILAAYIDYVVKYRHAAIARGLAATAARVARQPKPDVRALATAAAEATALRGAIGRLAAFIEWPAGYLVGDPIPRIGERSESMANSVSKLPAWAAFEKSRCTVASSIAAPAADAALKTAFRFDHTTAAFLRAFYMKWLGQAVSERQPLRGFDTVSHEAVVRDFRQIDEQVLRENRASLVGMLRDRVQHGLQQSDAVACLPRLRREITKQRRLSPLRRTLRDCGPAIRAIKPCFMMSPLTVAQYVEGGAPSFDLVIFDEASQLPTEDAIGAIVRGKQLVVVGDPKQLPPTNFFAVNAGASEAPLGDDGVPLYQDSESVLEEFMGAAVPMTRLKWHYRSSHESLISFSNVRFYDADLHTFPSCGRAAWRGFLLTSAGLLALVCQDQAVTVDEVWALRNVTKALRALGWAPGDVVTEVGGATVV